MRGSLTIVTENANKPVESVMVYTAAILISLVGYFVIGNLAGRRVKHLDDYLVAGLSSCYTFLWLQHASPPAAMAGRFGVSDGAVAGAYLLAAGCGTMLVIAGAVGFRLVRERSGTTQGGRLAES